MSAKISELPDADLPLTGTELMEVVQGGVNKKVAKSNVSTGGGSAVDSVNGETGVVVLDATDVGADPAGSASTVNTALGNHIADATDAHAGTAITNTPAGNLSATTVQTALNELDTEKVDKETFATLTFGSTTNWDQNSRQNPLAKVTVTGNFTINTTNVKDGAHGVLKVITNTASAVVLTFDTDFTNKTRDVTGEITLTTYTFPALTGQTYFLEFRVDGTTIEWEIKDYRPNYMARVQRAANQSLSTATVTAISWDTELIDNANIWTSGTDLTIPGTGNVWVTLTTLIDYAINSTGVRTAWAYKNGSVVPGGKHHMLSLSGVTTSVQTTFQFDAQGGDIITVRGEQNSGGSLNVVASASLRIEPR